MALEAWGEGPVWQIMKFRTPPGRTGGRLRNFATVWGRQLKLAVERSVLVDYKVLAR